MAATVPKEKEKHAKMPHQPHHLSRATATQDGWIESLTSLTESVAATRLLEDIIPLKVREGNMHLQTIKMRSNTASQCHPGNACRKQIGPMRLWALQR